MEHAGLVGAPDVWGAEALAFVPGMGGRYSVAALGRPVRYYAMPSGIRLATNPGESVVENFAMLIDNLSSNAGKAAHLKR